MIEVEITASALHKLPLYASFQVPEVWWFDGKRLVILELRDGEYAEREESGVFAKASATDLSRPAKRSLSVRRTEWLREVRTCLLGS